MKRINGRKDLQLREARQFDSAKFSIDPWCQPGPPCSNGKKGTASPNSELLPAFGPLFEVRIDDLYQDRRKEDQLTLITRQLFHLESDKFL